MKNNVYYKLQYTVLSHTDITDNYVMPEIVE